MKLMMLTMTTFLDSCDFLPVFQILTCVGLRVYSYGSSGVEEPSLSARVLLSSSNQSKSEMSEDSSNQSTLSAARFSIGEVVAIDWMMT